MGSVDGTGEDICGIVVWEELGVGIIGVGSRVGWSDKIEKRVFLW